MQTPHAPGNGQVVVKTNRSPALHFQRNLQTQAQSLTAPARTSSRPIICALAGAGLLWLCYFPVAWGWLGWVALVPLLALVRMEITTRRMLLAAWMSGLVFFFPVLQWIRVADYRMYATWISLALYCSLYVPAGVWLIRRLDRGTQLPLILTVPVVWTALEYVRAHALTGFAWYFLGHTQHDFLPVIQISDIAGAYGVTFVVAMVNALMFEWLYRWSAVRQLLGISEPIKTPRMACMALRIIAVAVLVAGTIGYGTWRLSDTDFGVGPRVALLQGNIDQRIKNEGNQDGDSDAAKSMVESYAALCHKAVGQQPRPDLIVWPETSWPWAWIESPAGVPNKDCRNMCDGLSKTWGISQLIGLNSSIGEDKDRRLHNSAVLIDGSGNVRGRYDKMHRVPFGEFVPFLDWFPWMSRFAPYDFDYSIRPGTEFTRFPVGQSHFGVLICYEDTDPHLARQYVGDESKVDFLINISNDGWFDGTSEHEEHLAICRFRAVESRRAVARAVNMGVSAIIDGNGRVLEPTPVPAIDEKPMEDVWEVRWQPGQARQLSARDWKRFKKVPAVITGSIPVDGRQSLYATWGDWLPQGCWLLVAGGLARSFVRRNVRM